MISLNERLKIVSNYITPGKLVDIGSDHAYLPIYAIQQHICDTAIAGEVIKGPFQAAQKNVAANALQDVVDVRLGDGLSVIHHDDNVNSITICGMGGPLIAKILNEGQSKLNTHPRLILQSNIQTQSIRIMLQQLKYEIIDEIIMEEKGHIYEIVVAEFNENLKQLTAEQLQFGPVLLTTKNDYFYKKWQRELSALVKIKSHLNEQQHKERLNELNADIAIIERVLKNDN
ncbi:tRNA (adenine(22)-N(1))-methyltransferase TrmK [Staphylococcus simiae]|uniref:tRNA (adenine(22)-N(1))-methyltransferase n=1 Tax=Staphylococcus simiae TaxID=308354 RepID=UPI001A978274|nr:tRNA (adenine(22)-N(1))-methyltransferase TrmK [Staphylococcus simiae]MBO1197956.1 tRNA (adenine(22)-N(1))-methyltransferase TrmK [Staphylococcus simiae]MBO1200433.1 tRNA (adenine(22)-N(1))-methyltransferase TrmK [Staphylococcus simiae]MBO1202706.1 tRNA (adenine(22)-N(1))-methyltransferase TrmK [Staphylococcus simiae]MBO1209947.1 tRNA (adenine(22)-N(1))-methyltransferase TrmK [Staphylococcus simiae]MBO1228850.1 tRNA (adenine(22)-N(1))-methyltransferase TrmK [Staphylococcus simiae]